MAWQFLSLNVSDMLATIISSGAKSPAMALHLLRESAWPGVFVSSRQAVSEEITKPAGGYFTSIGTIQGINYPAAPQAGFPLRYNKRTL